MLPRAALISVLLVPGAALACGMCADVLIKREYWWASTLSTLGMVAFLDAWIWFLSWACRRKVQILELVAPAVGIIGIGFAPPYGLGICAALVVLRRCFALRDRKTLPHAFISIAVLSFVAATDLATSRPSAVSGKSLVKLTSASPMFDWSLQPRNWAEEQLLTRSDTVQNIEAEFEEALSLASAEKAPRDASVRELALLRMHYIARGPTTFRASHCKELEFKTALERFRSAPRGGDPLSSRWIEMVCASTTTAPPTSLE